MFLYFFIFFISLLNAENDLSNYQGPVNINITGDYLTNIGNIYSSVNINGKLFINNDFNVLDKTNLLGDCLVIGDLNLVGNLNFTGKKIIFSNYKKNNLNNRYIAINENGLLEIADPIGDLYNYGSDININTIENASINIANNSLNKVNIGLSDSFININGSLNINNKTSSNSKAIYIGEDTIDNVFTIFLNGGNRPIFLKTLNDNIYLKARRKENSDFGKIFITADTNIYLSSSNIKNTGFLYLAGDSTKGFYLTTTNPSSIRYKENINNLSKIKKSFRKLRPVSFRYKNIKESLVYGLIAEELFEIDDFKDLVQFNDEKIEGINYFSFIPLIIQNAIETDENIDELKLEFENEKEDKDNKIALILEKISILSNQISSLGSELEVLKNNIKK